MAYCYVRDRDKALDIVQNMTCKALEKHTTLRNPKRVKTWLYRILVNECIDSLRKEKKECPTETEKMPEEVYVEPAYEKEDIFSKCLEQLPEKVRIIIQLRYYEELSLKEIAAITDTNLSTVKTRLYHGLEKLKMLLKEGGYEG